MSNVQFAAFVAGRTVLAAGSIVAATDILPVVRSGTTYQATLAALMTDGLKAPPAIGGTTPAAGTFTTLTATGNLFGGNGVLNILASGVDPTGAVDGAAALQTWLNTLTAGSVVILPPGCWIKIDSANITVPAGITIMGGNPYTNWLSTAGPFAGNGFYLNSSYTFIMGQGSSLNGLKIFRTGLLSSPTGTQSQDAVTAWGAEVKYLVTNGSTSIGSAVLNFASTTGVSNGMKIYGYGIPSGATVSSFTSTTVTMSANAFATVYNGETVRFGSSVAVTLQSGLGGAGPSAGVLLQDLFVVGFNTAILAGCGQFTVQRGWFDCYHGILVNHAGDQFYVNEMRCEPWYSMQSAHSYWIRPGVAYWVENGCTGGNFTNPFSFGWKTGYLVDGSTGIVLKNPQSEEIGTQSGGRGFVFQNACSVQVTMGTAINFLDASVDVQNPRGGTTPIVSLHGIYTLPGGVASYRIGASTQGKITAPLVNDNGITFLVAQANVVGPWYVDGPGFRSGSPTNEATIDATSVGTVRWTGSGFSNSFKLDPVTGDAYGGNARGTGAVDLQKSRTAADQIAGGSYAFLGAGIANKASGNTSGVPYGKQNTASAESAGAGGYNNTADGIVSFVGGGANKARGRLGAFVWGSNWVGQVGVQQFAIQTLGGSTSNATPLVLTADRGAAGAANVVNIPAADIACCVDVRVIAYTTGGTAGAATYIVNGMLLHRRTNAASTTLTGGGTITASNSTGTITGWVVAITADTTNAGLTITVTGASGQTIFWTATAITTEIGSG